MCPDDSLTRQTRDLRAHSRRLVRALGVIHAEVQDIGYTPAQCHALIEIADQGQLTVKKVAELLEIDKSTASRTLRPLVRDGLLDVSTDPSDQRARPVRLSAEGRACVRRIHAMADARVRSALGVLSDDERDVVLRGVRLYERALVRAKALEGVTIRRIAAGDQAEVARLFRSVMTEFGAVGSGYSMSDPEVDELHRAYSGKRCAYFVAERDGVLLGGGGIAPLAGAETDDVCELRKMHARPSARGLGIGRLLLERCLSAARSADYRLCYLETMSHMHQARALYEKLGFRALEGPLGNTGHGVCDGWYLLELQS